MPKWYRQYLTPNVIALARQTIDRIHRYYETMDLSYLDSIGNKERLAVRLFRGYPVSLKYWSNELRQLRELG